MPSPTTLSRSCSRVESTRGIKMLNENFSIHKKPRYLKPDSSPSKFHNSPNWSVNKEDSDEEVEIKLYK